jgi:Phage integrase family
VTEPDPDRGHVDGRADIPADPQRGEPGRDLPPEIMTVLCASLHTLEPAEVRVATQIGIDTGRRPEDILGLPLDCLARDKDGAAVLVYDNVKADRLGRRLPISAATAEVITSQQQRVRQRFPHAPAAKLRLLPTSYRNPDGTKPITRSTLEARHRDWVSTLPALRTRDGLAFDTAKIVPYAYRHSYAQRHADAGVPIDVLAELLDHRSYSVTRSYYRIGEDRRREAVDKVPTLSFDRHGNRIWRDARALLDSERARHAVGEVAVPTAPAPSPPTSRPAAAPARSGSAARAATISAPTSPSCPTCRPTSRTCSGRGSDWPPPSAASMNGPVPTPPPPRRRSPGSGT